VSKLIINPGVEFRNSRLELHNFRLRLVVEAGFVTAAFLALFARFFYLQVVRQEHYQTLAEANRVTIVPIAPNRGAIVDRNGVVLAHNDSAYALEITPDRIALAVIVENAGFGARAAVPIARRVFDYYLLGKEPEIVKENK
jgi:cell division protein FtsI/penicillin-binding protein 2